MSVEIWYVGRREVLSEGPAEVPRLSAEATGNDDEVVYVGQREKPGKDLPLRMKDSLSDGEETQYT